MQQFALDVLSPRALQRIGPIKGSQGRELQTIFRIQCGRNQKFKQVFFPSHCEYFQQIPLTVVLSRMVVCDLLRIGVLLHGSVR